MRRDRRDDRGYYYYIIIYRMSKGYSDRHERDNRDKDRK